MKCRKDIASASQDLGKELEMRGNDIRQMIENGELEQSDATISCPGCEAEVLLYNYKYDEEMNAFVCQQCTYADWANDVPSKHNPRKCPNCGNFVTDDDVEAGESIECGKKNIHDEISCNQLAHKQCVDLCEDCGWFCEDHERDYAQCDSCGLPHHHDHFVSGGKEFVECFGDICWSCWQGDDDRFEPPDDSSPEEVAEESTGGIKGKISSVIDAFQNAKSTVIGLVATAVEPNRKRRDSSKYLSHFVRRRPGMSDDDCFNQLSNILKDGKLLARPTGYFSTYNQDPQRSAVSKAICFTEGRLTALHDHAKEYSPFGIAFSKFALLKYAKASPVIHIHEDLINQTRGSLPLEIVPYVNLITPEKYNFQHEREWRVPHDLHFKTQEIAFIFAPHAFHTKLNALTNGDVKLYCIDTVIEI